MKRTWTLLGHATSWLVALSGAARGGADELTIVFDVTREAVRRSIPPVRGVAKPAEAAAKRTKETYRAVIGLAKDYVSVTNEGVSTDLTDFSSKRIYSLDLREKTHIDSSLYGLVAYRVNELFNLRAMREGFIAGKGLEQNERVRDLLDWFTMESVFSRRLPTDAGRADAPVPTVVHRGKEWEFSHGGRRFVRFLPSDRAVPPEHRRSWTRFLVCPCRIHPAIREQIVKTGAIPELLEYYYYDGIEDCTTTYRLVSVSEGPERWGGIPPGFTARRYPGDRLWRIVARIDPQGGGDTLRTGPATERFVDEALGRGNALDAYLGCMEFIGLGGNGTGGQSPQAALVAKVLLTKDARVLALRFKQGRPEDEAVAILKVVDGIDRQGLKKGYQLDVYRGFLLMVANRIDEANDAFLTALEANPYLSNCYKQLADNYFGAYATGESWRCVDAIRRFDPKYYLLKGTNELEARLEKDFPEDF